MSRYERFILVDDNEADNVYHGIMIRARRLHWRGAGVRDRGRCARLLPQRPNDGVHLHLSRYQHARPQRFRSRGAGHADLLADKPTVMLVMLTSSGSPADRERAASLPVIRGYVTKPLEVDGIKALMAETA